MTTNGRSLTTTEACEAYGCSPAKLHQGRREGKLTRTVEPIPGTPWRRALWDQERLDAYFNGRPTPSQRRARNAEIVDIYNTTTASIGDLADKFDLPYSTAWYIIRRALDKSPS